MSSINSKKQLAFERWYTSRYYSKYDPAYGPDVGLKDAWYAGYNSRAREKGRRTIKQILPNTGTKGR